MKYAFILSCALIAACGGTWSDADIEFIRPVPTSQDLTLTPPSNNTSSSSNPLSGTGSQQQGLGSADGGQSATYTSTVSGIDGIDNIIEGIGALLDAVRSVPPSSRPSSDERIWGPWDDNQHPGYQGRITMTRTDTTPVAYTYAADELPPGGSWTRIVDGQFFGDRATNGKGTIDLHDSAMRSIGIASPTDMNAEVDLTYNLTNGQACVSLSIQAVSGATAASTYQVEPNGAGEIVTTIDNVPVPNTSPQQFASMTVNAHWLRDKSGSAFDTLTGGGLGAAMLDYSECWDTNFNQVFVSAMETCNGAADCCSGASTCSFTQGDAGQCSIPPPTGLSPPNCP
jgi:hypothetical protein